MHVDKIASQIHVAEKLDSKVAEIHGKRWAKPFPHGGMKPVHSICKEKAAAAAAEDAPQKACRELQYWMPGWSPLPDRVLSEAPRFDTIKVEINAYGNKIVSNRILELDLGLTARNHE